MLKTRTLTLTAVVAVGAIALGAPTLAGANPGPASPASISDQIAKLKQAGKSAKSRAHTSSKWSKGIDKSIDRTNTAITRLGNNVYDLRKANDQTNWTISQIAGAAISALTQLQAGLVGLAASYTNFQYGVVQLGACSDAACTTFTPFPGSFVATPRLDPTVEQATVSASFAPPTAAVIVGASVAVRSANPTANDANSKAYCRVTTTQNGNGAGQTKYATSVPNPGFNGAPAYEVPRSNLIPNSAADLLIFPLSMVATDNQVNLVTDTNAAGFNGGGGVLGGFTNVGGGVGGAALNVTLSCLSVPNPA